MTASRARAMLLAVAAAAAPTACSSSNSSDDSSASAPTLPDPTTSSAPPTTSEVPAVSTSPRGNIVKALGEEGGIADENGNPYLTFTVDAITADAQ